MPTLMDMLKPNSRDARIRRLWKQITELHGEGADFDKKAALCTELLGIVPESGSIPTDDDVLRQRGQAWHGLREYENAIKDIHEALLLSVRRGQGHYTYNSDCLHLQLIHTDLRKELISQGGGLAEQLMFLEEMGRVMKIYGGKSNRREGEPITTYEAAFDKLIEATRDPAKEVRFFADQLIGTLQKKELARYIILDSREMSWKSAAVGRALGRTFPPGKDGNVQPATFLQELGEWGRGKAFAMVGCAYQGYFNLGVPIPVGGLYTSCYSRKEAGGVYSIPVVCDDCGKLFWAVWEQKPF